MSIINWVSLLSVLFAAVIVLQEFRWRKRHKNAKEQERLLIEASSATIEKATTELKERTKAFEALQVFTQRQEQDLAIKDTLLRQKDNTIAESEGKVLALTSVLEEKRKQASPKALLVSRPASPFKIPIAEILEITPLLKGALRYIQESAALRFQSYLPENTVVLARYSKLESDGPAIFAAMPEGGSSENVMAQLILEVDDEKQNLAELKVEATIFYAKVDLMSQHIQYLNVGDFVDLARDFSSLVFTGGTSLLRILSKMNASLDFIKLERKADRIIMQLNAEQVGRLNGILLTAGESFFGGAIDQARILSKHDELLILECQLLAELRGLLAGAPDVETFQLVWGRMQRSSREKFYNQHFLGAVGKIRLAIVAFVVDLLLVNETAELEAFILTTVAQLAAEVKGIAEILKSQLLIVREKQLTVEPEQLKLQCDNFCVLLDGLTTMKQDPLVPGAGEKIAH